MISIFDWEARAEVLKIWPVFTGKIARFVAYIGVRADSRGRLHIFLLSTRLNNTNEYNGQNYKTYQNLLIAMHTNVIRASPSLLKYVQAKSFFFEDIWLEEIDMRFLGVAIKKCRVRQSHALWVTMSTICLDMFMSDLHQDLCESVCQDICWTPRPPPPLLPTFDIYLSGMACAIPSASDLNSIPLAKTVMMPVRPSQRSDLTRARDGTEKLDVHFPQVKSDIESVSKTTNVSDDTVWLDADSLVPSNVPPQAPTPEDQLARLIAFYQKFPIQKQRRLCLDKFVPPYNPYSEQRNDTRPEGDREIPVRLAKHELGIKICPPEDFIENVAVHLAKIWPSDVKTRIFEDRKAKKGPSIISIARKLVTEAYLKGYVPSKIPPPFPSSAYSKLSKRKKRRCEESTD